MGTLLKSEHFQEQAKSKYKKFSMEPRIVMIHWGFTCVSGIGGWVKTGGGLKKGCLKWDLAD